MSALVILACIVQTIEQGPQTDPRCADPYVLELQSAIVRWSAEYGVPASIEAAKIYHESGFNKHARGKRGEVGLSQLLRHGAIQGAELRLTRRQLEHVDTNVRIGVEYLAQFVRECKSPSGWLTRYNRPSRGCRSSRYSRGVLADLRAARAIRLDRPGRTSAGTPDSAGTETSNWGLLAPPPDHTWYKLAGRRTTTPPGTGGSLPSSTDLPTRWSGPAPGLVLESLTAPFAEP